MQLTNDSKRGGNRAISRPSRIASTGMPLFVVNLAQSIDCSKHQNTHAKSPTCDMIAGGIGPIILHVVQYIKTRNNCRLSTGMHARRDPNKDKFPRISVSTSRHGKRRGIFSNVHEVERHFRTRPDFKQYAHTRNITTRSPMMELPVNWRSPQISTPAVKLT